MLGSSPTIIKSGSGDSISTSQLRHLCWNRNNSSKQVCKWRTIKEFLRFAEKYLTGYKSDPAHNPSFKSCMIRIPWSINSKNGGKQVEIVQRWDGVTRPKINLLLYKFSRWLIYNRVKGRSKPVYQQQATDTKQPAK